MKTHNKEQLDKLYDLRDRYDTLGCYYHMHLTQTEKARVDVMYKQAKDDYFNYMLEIGL